VKNRQGHVTSGSVLDDLGFAPAEALEVRIKGDLHRDLLRFIQARQLTQQQLAEVLEIHQPDVSHLLNGRVSKFSMDKLIRFAGKLNLDAQIKLKKPRPVRREEVKAPGRPRTRAAA
jgi:predicted XRE-type DNA-binding protein